MASVLDLDAGTFTMNSQDGPSVLRGGSVQLSQLAPRAADQDPGMQVWCEGELIGWLAVDPNYLRGGFYDLVMIDDLPSLTAGYDDLTSLPVPSPRQISLRVVRRTASISLFEVNMARNEVEVQALFRKRHNVPSSASMDRDNNTDAYVFRWRVFDVTVAQSETIFDLDNFTPNPDHR